MVAVFRSLSFHLSRKCTVYISHSIETISLQGSQLYLVNKSGKEQNVALENIRRVVLIGCVNIASEILYQFISCGIHVDWLDLFCKPKGQLFSMNAKNEHYIVRQQDFIHQNTIALELARYLLLAKVINLFYILRNRVHFPHDLWAKGFTTLQKANTSDEIRGAEGALARLYFNLWKNLTGKFIWNGRQAHPPPDPLNALLSLGYTLLYNRLASSLHHSGLDARIGFFHMIRGSHLALASDLMEPFRSLIDSAILRLVRKRMISPEQFSIQENYCHIIDHDVLSKVLKYFEDTFEQDVTIFCQKYQTWEKRTRTFNDHLDDLAQSYCHILKTHEIYHDWMLMPWNFT